MIVMLDKKLTEVPCDDVYSELLCFGVSLPEVDSKEQQLSSEQN